MCTTMVTSTTPKVNYFMTIFSILQLIFLYFLILVLYMESDWSIFEFLNAASQRLAMESAAKRVFNADGVEINDCMLIEDDDMLFLSINDDFIAPADMVAEESDSTTAPAYRIPTIIGGYRVSDLLGRGGFGEVRVGEHSLTGERVALKFLRKSEISSLGAAERTNTEIQCLMTLKHNNIIRLMNVSIAHR
ncbi:hypothetical protein EON65_17675 [archaeon]|nr:MAG: hypothetical protein EON65_17675 [archaeon]